MASLTKKIIRGKPYYYLRESKRVNGKPKGDFDAHEKLTTYARQE